jgi:hypothetical protein
VNTFAEILPIKELSKDKVRYYTIKEEGKADSMFMSFIRRCCTEEPRSLESQALIDTLLEIGSRGAKDHYFAHEKKALRIKYIGAKEGRKLRLYCYKMSYSVVILFSGGVKSESTRTAQECPEISPFFHQAQKVATALDAAIVSQALRRNDITGELIVPNDFSF